MNQPCLSPAYLARQEIRRRPWQFLLSACGVAVGVAVVGGCMLGLARERLNTEEVLHDQQREVDERFADYGNALAEAMTKAGFNITILPRDQDLGDWYDESFAAKSLPADTVERLAARPLETVEHLLPVLTGRLDWPERSRPVIVRGTAPRVLHPNAMASRFLDRSVPADMIDVGSEIAQELSLVPDQELIVAGHSFRIHRCRPPTGTRDDIALHLSIEAARDLLGKPGAVNEIIGLERPAAWGDIERIRAELANRLPEAQVFEVSNRVVATMRSRRMAERESRTLLDQERQRRQRLVAGHTRLALAASLAAVALSSLWLAVMTFLNLARRRGEAGLLAALGVSSGGVRAMFLVRLCLAVSVGVVLGTAPWFPYGIGLGLDRAALWLCVGAVSSVPPLLATVAAMHYQLSRQDPADVLKNEV